MTQPITCTVHSSSGACGQPAVWSNGEFAECASHAKDIGSLASVADPSFTPARLRNTTHRFTVAGIDLTTRTNRRYVCVVYRPQAITTAEGTYVAFARVDKRSDNVATLRDHIRRQRSIGYVGIGVGFAIIDTETGEEVA